MKTNSRIITLALVCALCLATFAGPALAVSLGTQVLEVAGVGFVVTKAAGPLDKFINAITFRHGMKSSLATKVVPVLSVGEKGYVGGAQVIGPKTEVEKVKAVFQYEKNFSHNNYRIKVLLPSSSLNPLKIGRVPKVGVSATIDVSLDGGLRYRTVGTSLGAGELLKGAGVLVAIKNFGSQINKGLNTLTFNKGYSTKVVPMATIGEKAYVGGAQVSAAPSAIDSVKALWQYEDLFMDGKFRVKVLIPTSSSNPLKMKRVNGAGLTALIDFALTKQSDVQPERKRSGGILGGIVDKIKTPKTDANDKDDNGLHKGWDIGKHKGWDKNADKDQKPK